MMDGYICKRANAQWQYYEVEGQDQLDRACTLRALSSRTMRMLFDVYIQRYIKCKFIIKRSCSSHPDLDMSDLDLTSS